MKFMKAMYVIWPDYDYIQKAIDAGIDTFIVRTGVWDTEENLLKLFEHFQGKAKMIPAIDWFRPDRILPKNQQFFDGTKFWESTPCPLSLDYIKDMLQFEKSLCDKYGGNIISIDFESYGSRFKNPQVFDYYGEWEEDKHKCMCGVCENMNEAQQRKANANIIKQEIGGLMFYHFPYVNPYIWEVGNVWFNEFTYEGFSDWSRILKNTSKMKKEFNITTDNASGFWMEKFNARDYLDILEQSVRSPANDGYWLYPQMRMSKNCYWRLHPEDPYSIDALGQLQYQSFIDSSEGDSDPAFFGNLKFMNSRIDSYRSGWMFTLKSLIYRFFK